MTVPSSGILASTSRALGQMRIFRHERVSRRIERYDLRLDLRQAMTAWRCGCYGSTLHSGMPAAAQAFFQCAVIRAGRLGYAPPATAFISPIQRKSAVCSLLVLSTRTVSPPG
ncbi:hypothetical protein [Gluconobacter japonicus]|uniref:hypothetical protein n=1 Tax=Gluconobacter japonicus TaxID=376620 RepID=UPI0039E926AA